MRKEKKPRQYKTVMVEKTRLQTIHVSKGKGRKKVKKFIHHSYMVEERVPL